jgi:tetratricopeptide (TPR) repeat protein
LRSKSENAGIKKARSTASELQNHYSQVSMNSKTLSIISVAVTGLVLQLQTSVSAESLLEEGNRFYTEGNFGSAARCFHAEIKANPKDAHAHYLMANTLLELGRKNEALIEYEQALKLEPTGAIQSNCQKAIHQLTQPSQHAAPPQNGSTLRPEASATSTPQNPESEAIRNASGKIGAQTNQSETQMSAEYEAKIRDINGDADRQVATLQAEQAARINDLPAGHGGRNSYNPARESDTIRSEISARIQAVRDTQARKKAEFQEFIKTKSSAAEDAAITLDRQYLNRNEPGAIKLSPTGTSVYVRSYETSDEPSGARVPVALPPARSLNQVNSSSPHSAVKKNDTTSR